jgi:hypothetical protein
LFPFLGIFVGVGIDADSAQIFGLVSGACATTGLAMYALRSILVHRTASKLTPARRGNDVA